MARGRMRTVKGIVIKNSTLKTLMVQVETRSKNKKYSKVSILKKKFPVHDEKMIAEVGDIIEAVETKPISKTKRWNLIKVVEKGVNQ
jgi:small subunit ribosomal protein S17|tara:strand:+ start:26302 stop:26562 length:261 start_codon:yes stop_codon:yes gene_type:complete